MALTTRCTTTTPLLIASTTTGTVSVSFDDGETWVRFRTVDHYRACMDHLAGLDVDGEQARVAHYQAMVRELREQRDRIG